MWSILLLTTTPRYLHFSLSLSLARSLSRSLAHFLSHTNTHTLFANALQSFFFLVFFCVCAKFPSYLRGGDFNGFLTCALLCSCSSIFPVSISGSWWFLWLFNVKKLFFYFFFVVLLFFSRSVVRGGSWRRQSCAGPTSWPILKFKI
jgi:hypothetical protein